MLALFSAGQYYGGVATRVSTKANLITEHKRFGFNRVKAFIPINKGKKKTVQTNGLSEINRVLNEIELYLI